ncbi:MAG: hypothetical protein JSV04_13020 [Candidatus Heimdallarchaeota archaeon]|nr:MAG: hypothetical protein JSV04_13020 [Candidatus Heimdallarchaeota archaeon]
MFTKDQFPPEVIKICQILINHGFQAFLVGGSIRDIIQGEHLPQDWDIATDAKPSEVMEIYKNFRVIPTGIKHGTVTIVNDQFSIEVTTFRVESDYSDGRRPSEVSFVKDIVEDLSRRDLTVNAIAYDPINEIIVDPFSGISDIQAQIIRMVGDPDERLKEDGLRLIRVFRFVAQLGFDVDSKTIEAIPNHYDVFAKVAKERIHSEFQKLVGGAFFQKAIFLLEKSGLLYHLIPEFNSEKFHVKLPEINLSRIELTLQIISNVSVNASLRLRFTLLFHQVPIVAIPTSKIFPPLHEKFIHEFLKGLKFSNKQITEISHILKVHTFSLPYSLETKENIKDYSIRKFQFHIRPEYLIDYLTFYQAKEQVIQNSQKYSKDLRTDILSRALNNPPIDLKDLTLNGDDIIQYFQLNKKYASQREFIGLCLQIIRERVELEPHINQKRDLLLILENLKKIVSQCTTRIGRQVRVISTDHIRKMYCGDSPKYLQWESKHTYQLANWLIQCLLRKDQDSIVIFDGTNFNMPAHPTHRELLAKKFRKYNPLYIHTIATEEEVKLNLEAREQESSSIKKSDADFSIFKRYQNLLETYPKALDTPTGYELIKISPRKSNFGDFIKEIIHKIHQNKHRFIIMSGNVLTGKTFTSYALQKNLES